MLGTYARGACWEVALLLVQYFSEQCPLLRPDTSPGYTASCYLPGCDTHTDTTRVAEGQGLALVRQYAVAGP